MCTNKSDAYVDGGMYFDQNDKKLYVPTCGYYYISSHIFWLTESYGAPNVPKMLQIEIFIYVFPIYKLNPILIYVVQYLSKCGSDIYIH